MIQDIGIGRFDNSYKNVMAADGDVAMVFDEGRIAVRRTKEGLLEFPRCGEFTGEFRYLFDIDGAGHFLFMEKTAEIPQDCTMEHVRELRDMGELTVCFAAATAYHLAVWYRDSRFCGRCGHLLEHSKNQRMMKCPECGNEVYPKIAPAVIVGVRSGNKLLLTKYAGRVYKKYALIAGFVEIGETAEETVKREVMEEVGLKVKNIIYYGGQPWGTDSNLLLGYFADLDGSGEISLDQEELSTAQWFEREDIPVGDDGISLTREMITAFKNGRY